MKYKIKKLAEVLEVKFVKKVANIIEYRKRIEKKDYSKRIIFINKEIKLSKENFKSFSENFLIDYQFLKNSCEFIKTENLFSGLIITDGKDKIIVETQGYDYPRYIAII